MTVTEKKTVDMLTPNGVSILTQNMADIDGIPTQVGANHRVSYVNSLSGRQKLTEDEPEDISAAVMTIWGDEPIVEEPPTEETRAEELETNQEVD